MFIFLSVFSVTWIVLSMLPFLLLLVSTMCATNNFCQAILQSNTDLAQYLPQEQIGQLTDWIHDTSLNQVESKRNVPSLSIVNPLDVLRQKLLLDIARRRMRQAKGQVDANREWLKSIGKRSSQLSDD